jgi:hypothetical protein
MPERRIRIGCGGNVLENRKDYSMVKLIIFLLAILFVANPIDAKDQTRQDKAQTTHTPQAIQLDPVKAAAYIPKVAGTTPWQWLLSAELIDLNSKPLAKKIALPNDSKTVDQVMRGKLGTRLPPKLEVVFGKEITQFDGKEIRLAGFMLPLDMKEKQTHFMLSAYPASCPYCLPGGPNATIEVFCKKGVTFTFDPIVLRGKLKLLRDDPSGFFYRMTDVVAVR